MNNLQQSTNGQPIPKKPKLDVDNRVSSSAHFRSSPDEGDSPGGDIIYEIWERDANISSQHKPNTVRQELSNSLKSSTQNTVGDMIDEIWGDDLDLAALEKVDFDESLALSQMPETVNPCIESSPKRRTHNATKNSPRVPWRRTASSGWPTASSSLSFSATSKSISNKNVNDNNSTHLGNQSGVEQLLLENKSLKAQLTRKTGEANLIRGRLHSVEQEYDKKKKGYSDKIDVLKKEGERNSAQLLKEIRSLKSQLEVKTMEMETAERRVQHMSSMNKLNAESPRSRGILRPVYSPVRVSARQSQREDQLMCRHGQMKSKLYTYSLDYLKQLVTPELMKPTQLEPPIDNTHISCTNSISSGQSVTNCQPSSSRGYPLMTELQQLTNNRQLLTGIEKLSIKGLTSSSLFYSSENSMESLTAVLGKFNSTCPSLEPCSISLLSPRLLDINSENAHQVILQVLEACLQILLETFQQLNVTTPKHCIERDKEVPLPVAMDLTQTIDLLCHKELYNNERGICARRALALQSILVQFSSFAAESILPREELDRPTSGIHQMMILIRDIFHLIKIQSSHNFDGLLAAVMALIKSILQADVSLSQLSQELIVQILQAVSSLCSGNLVLYYILQVLQAAAKYPQVTASLCQNSDKCILQGICTLLQLSDAPKKHILSDLFTSWVLTLFYGKGLSSPKWLFSIPSQTSCQCRPLISRLCLTMLGEACSMFPRVTLNEKSLIEKLLNRGVLLVSTLLYHDEHFGANVDPASEGHYELYIWSMNTFLETQEIKLNAASRTFVKRLSTSKLTNMTLSVICISLAISTKCLVFMT